MIYTDLVDVPIDVYGGYVPAIPPSDLPPGASPLCQDVIFPEGSVRTRGGLSSFFGDPQTANNPLQLTSSVNGLKSYLTPTLAKRLLAWDSLGSLYKENHQGTLNLVASRPYTDLLYQSTTLFGREYQALFNSLGGFDIPHQFDDTNFDRVSQCGPGGSPLVVDSAAAGNIAAGKHQVAVAFITRQGFITAPSVPPTTWTAAGVKQAVLSQIAIGPPNIVARLVMFTPVITAPATTGSFYSTPTGSTQLATPTVMLINDNTTTTLTVDFTDAILIASFQANYLFSQLELGESAFVAGYSSRLAWLGERNKQSNFINTTFDGGFGTGTPTLANTAVTYAAAAVDSAGLNRIWNFPVNAKVLDGVSATAANPSPATNQLMLTQFGFAIPSNATILGVKAVATVKGDIANAFSDFGVYLIKNGFQISGNRKNGNLWSAVLATQTYGGSADLWGLTLTPADINDATFGVSLSAINYTTGTLASVDAISLQIFYSTPSAAGLPPLGWTQGASFAGGDSALNKALTADWGDALAITGDGVAAIRGQISQSAYQDYLLQPIIARNTAYRVRCRAANFGMIRGTIHINLSSVIGGFTTGGLAIQIPDFSGIVSDYAEFDALLTNAIIAPPTDLLLNVYADGTPTNNGTFLIDSIEIYPENAPFNYSTVRFSHSFNPESYDSVTGQIQVRPNDGQQLRAAFPIRNDFYIAKDHYLAKTTDDGVNEPAQWALSEVDATVGICGPNAVDWTEEWAAFAERSGLYVIWGGDPVKITQEIQEDASLTGKITWSSINWQYGHTVWVRIDQTNKRILVGAPTGEATKPNVVFVLDYKWLDTAQDIASSPLVTYSAFTGKILAHGRGRRWTYWNISANSMTFAERSDGTAKPFFGNNVANGKIYQQIDAPTQLSDDSAAINSYYATYYAPSSTEEQMMKLSADRKLLGGLKWRAVGSGSLLISIAQANRVTNLRSYTLSLFPTGDGERAVNLHGERFSIQISTNAVDSYFQLEKLIVKMRRDATIPLRGVSA